jgi:hypothetical protein
MGKIGKCCCELDCIEPPDMEIDGLTEASGWHPGAPDWYLPDSSFCCWEKRFTYDGWPVFPTKYTSDVVNAIALEFIGRLTVVATVGTIDGGDCVDQSEQELAYRERWAIYEDAYRKYAYVGPQSNEVIVKATLIEIIESGLPVLYWLFSITEGFTATYGLDRKFRSYNDVIQDSLAACFTWRGIGGADANDPNYASRPTSSWVEQTPTSSGYEESSVTFGKVKFADLEALDPGDWLEIEVATTDADTSAVEDCIPGVQDPFELVYSLDPPPDCSQIEVVAVECGEGIDTTGNVLFAADFLLDTIASLGFLNSGCCVNTGSLCDDDPLVKWNTTAEVITSDCSNIDNNVNLVVDSAYTVRFRLP